MGECLVKCKYCGNRRTRYTDVCSSCAAIEYHLIKHAQPQGRVVSIHNNAWAIREVNRQYEGDNELVAV